MSNNIYASYPFAGSSGVPIYSTFSAFPATAATGSLGVAADTGILYEFNGTSWVAIGGPGAALTIGSPANGLSITANALSIALASTSTTGALSNTDWNAFNNKQAAGNYITALTGDGTASGPGSAALTLATVNLNTGSFGSSTAIPNFTVNGKGLITAAGTSAVVAPAGTLSGTTLNSTVVTSSLTSVGIIGTGTWQGTAIGPTYGGTNQTSYTTGDTLYASASNTLSKLAIGSTGNVLTIAGGVPTWAAPATAVFSGLTQYAPAYALTTTTIGTIASTGTTGNPLVSGGAASAPVYSATPTLAGIINTSNVLSLKDSTDNTKVLALNISGMTTAKTLTLTSAQTTTQSLAIPNITGADTLATLGLAQTFSAVQTFTPAPIFSSVTASQVLTVNGSKALTSIAYSTTPAASTIAEWDANKNLSANNLIEGYRTTATAAGTTALLVGDAYQQYFTGSTTQTVTMPVVSGLVLGQQYLITNLSTGVVTVQSSGANNIQAMASNSQLLLTCILTSGTTAASWSWTYSPVASTGLPLTNPMTTGGDIIYGGSSGTPTRLANGTAGQWLRSAGSTSAPTWSSFTAPTVQRFTSGSGTYTTPAGVLYIIVEMVGGGGGGGGSGTGSTGGTGTTGGATTFGSILTTNGGVGGTGTAGAISTGGSPSVTGGTALVSVAGGSGQGAAAISSTAGAIFGGIGGSSAYGGAGAGAGNVAGNSAAATSGSGGGGGGSNQGTAVAMTSGAGGGSGAFVRALITSPSASYSYSVGSGGGGGTAGTSGQAGGNGGSGLLFVTEYYS